MPIELSIVIPFFNEEGSIKELHRMLNDSLKAYGSNVEFVFIDDGSTDSSNDIVRQLKTQDKRIRLITFRRNRGKSAALALGFRVANGDKVVTMDADLQDDP